MHRSASRAGRWPLALTFAALALGACDTNEPAAPRYSSPKPNLAAQWDTSVVVVTNTSGGTDVGSLRWAADKVRLFPGKIVFDSALGGKTVTLDTGLFLFQPVEITAPSKGVTISGKDQFRLIKANAPLKLTNVTLTKGYNEFGSAIAGVNVTLDHSTVTGNRGGTAISIEKGITLVNSTVSGNSVQQQPAIYYLSGSTVTIDNSTIAYNSPGAGIGMFGAPNQWAVGLMRNSIISNNGANGSPKENCNNLVGFTYQGTNISDDGTCGGVAMTVADPQLLPLANNGGPSMTHAIPHTSPAYNQGFACSQATDQRYITRDAKCDVGAFEFNDWTNVTIAIDPNVKVDAAGKAALTGTVTCTRNDAFRLTLELHQDQKVGKQVVDVHAVNDIPVTCGTTPKAWTATMGLVPGEKFQAGAARATAATFQTPDWVTPASTAGAVKISFARK